MSFDLKQAIAAAPEGSVLEVPAGTWAGGLLLTKGLTLRGHEEANFDGLGRGPIITVNAPGAEVTLIGFTFTNATALAGAGVLFHEGRLVLKDCRFERCFAPGHGGGAVYARGESLVVERCRFERNTGRQGGALLLDQLINATVRDSVFLENTAVRGGALRLKEGAQLVLDGCTLGRNQAVGPTSSGAGIDLAGTVTRAPRLELRACVWAGESASELGRAPKQPGEVVIEHSLLPLSVDAAGLGNRAEAVTLDAQGRLPVGTWATEAAPQGHFAGRVDVNGSPRGAALGAFATAK